MNSLRTYNEGQLDCAVIGGGPAGLNAALVLGRARRDVALIDEGKPRNRVTHASHGFVTRDGVQPAEFRRIAREELRKYPSVRQVDARVTDIRRTERSFELQLTSGERLFARKVIVAAGLKETLPEIEGIRSFYGTSLFACPFCDGWELRDQPLAVISDQQAAAFHKAKLLLNWTRDLIVCTDGSAILTGEQREQLESRGIRIVDTKIASFSGREGKLERIHFADGTQVERSGGFLDPAAVPYVMFEESLGYRTESSGAIVTDAMGRSTVPGVYAAGDSASPMPSQLIYAAASGSRAAMGVMADFVEEDWNM